MSVVGANTDKVWFTRATGAVYTACARLGFTGMSKQTEKYWRAKIAITNFNHGFNYTQWTLVVQHPNLSNLTEVFRFAYKPLLPYQSIS